MHQPTSNKELPGKVVHIERKIKKIKTIRERMQNVLILPHHRNPKKWGHNGDPPQPKGAQTHI